LVARRASAGHRRKKEREIVTYNNNSTTQAERLAMLHNDNPVPRRRAAGASTFLDHVESPAGGRFAELARREREVKPAVIGRDPAAQYPRLPTSSPWFGDNVGTEPPLGYAVNDMEPVGEARELAASLGDAEAPADGHPSSVVETASPKPTSAEERLAEILPRIAIKRGNL
jgi:hypothetical protein